MNQKINPKTDNSTINLVLDTLEKNKQALVFVNTKRSAEKTAEDISKKIKKTNPEFMELSEKALKALSSPTKQCRRLAECLKKGIAFHHAGLHSKQKDLIEESFRKSVIKIICATPTLAYGLDLPAYRAILKDLRRYGHRGLQFIPVLEYLQMAGRAGRPKFDNEGEAIAICGSEAERNKIWDRYILGEPEDIFSKLAVEPVLRTYLLSLIASDFVNNKKDIFSFFNKTFWAYQFQDMEKLEMVIENMLNLLSDWEFIISSKKDDFQSANEVSNEKYKATMTGKRVAELYIDSLSAHNLINAIKTTRRKSATAFSFLQSVSHTLEMMPLLRVRVKGHDDIQEELLKNGDCMLEEEPNIYDFEYDDFLNSIKTALMLNEWVDEKDDEYLLEKYSIRPGELRVKLNITNWLLYSMEELARILKFKEIIKEITKLRLRIKHGAREELLTLLKLRDIGRVRARKMYNYGIKDIADVKRADVMTLVQLIGKNTALKVKEHVGEKVKEEIKITKRRGQLSLGKF